MNKKKTSQYHLMHHLIHKIPNCKPTVAEQTIQIYVETMDYQMSVLFPLWIVFVKNRQELGKSNITSSRIKPLNYCLAYNISHNFRGWRELISGDFRPIVVL